MSEITTVQDANRFWAAKGSELDTFAKDFERYLPPVDGAQEAFDQEQLDELRTAFDTARVAAEAILGRYARAYYEETTAASHYQASLQSGQPNYNHARYAHHGGGAW